MTNRTRTDSLLLAGVCAFLFFYGLDRFGLIGADEPRYAQVAHEMLERCDWITPVLGGRPWLEKPPLYYWQAMLAYRMFGVSDWAARLPSAVDATLLVLAVYFFLRRFRPGVELDGALMVASCGGILGYARAASMDMALAAAFTVSMLSWWAWRETEKKLFLLPFYGCVALGALAKGPIAPFLAIVVIVSYAIAVRELRLLLKTLWLPGLLLFCVVALPWYFAVQARNPQFFHEFILEHNLGRFSKNLYHHTEPFWYYLPVTALALLPWAAFALAALGRPGRALWAARTAGASSAIDSEYRLGIFAGFWLLVPLTFFSISQSKLPGYILPAVPAGGLLLADDLKHRLEDIEARSISAWLAVPHALLAAAPIAPALLIAYLITQHRLPGFHPTLGALTIAFILGAGIALTLLRRAGVRMLRFVTLIPIVLTVWIVLNLGSAALDQALSARTLARQIAGVPRHPMRLAVHHIRRELEYGLTFYRNELTLNYDWGVIPEQEHILVAPENSQGEIARLMPGRRVVQLDHYDPQHVDYFWIAAAAHP